MGIIKQLRDRFGLSGVPRQRVSPTKRIGVGGAAIFGGFLDEREDSSDLRGREKYLTYSDAIANTAIISAGMRFFLNLVSKATWKVEPAPDSGARGEELAELIEDMIFDMDTPWPRVVRRAAMYRSYGFSLQEWTAKRREDGAIGFLDVEPRPQVTIERWDTDDAGQVVGAVQRSPQDSREIYLPRTKLVYIVDDTLNDTPEGLGLLRNVIELSRRLRRYEQLEGWGYETDLRGTPLARAPLRKLQESLGTGNPPVTQADIDKAVDQMKELLRNHIANPERGILLDSQPWVTIDERQTPSAVPHWNLELLKGGSTNLQDAGNTIERINREIARVLGVEHLLLGSGSAGSYALSRDKTNNFALVVDSTLKELAWSFDQDLLGPLFMLNGWPEELRPTLKTESIQYKDVEEVVGALRQLADAGAPMLPTDEAVGEVYDLIGLTRPERDDMELDALIPTTMPQPQEGVDQPQDEVPERDGEGDDAPEEE